MEDGGQDYIQFEINGFVPPWDILRLNLEGMHSCGKARLGMSLDVNYHGMWAPGVIDHKDLRKIHKAIGEHLEKIDVMTEEEREKAMNPFC